MLEFAETLRSFWVLWLTALFVGIVAWAFWPGNSKKFESLGRIPLEDDVTEEKDAD